MSGCTHYPMWVSIPALPLAQNPEIGVQRTWEGRIRAGCTRLKHGIPGGTSKECCCRVLRIHRVIPESSTATGQLGRGWINQKITNIPRFVLPHKVFAKSSAEPAQSEFAKSDANDLWTKKMNWGMWCTQTHLTSCTSEHRHLGNLPCVQLMRMKL